MLAIGADCRSLQDIVERFQRLGEESGRCPRRRAIMVSQSANWASPSADSISVTRKECPTGDEAEAPLYDGVKLFALLVLGVVDADVNGICRPNSAATGS